MAVLSRRICPASVRITRFRIIFKERAKIVLTNPHLILYALRSEEHTSELQSQSNLVCRLLLEKKKKFADLNPYQCTGGVASSAGMVDDGFENLKEHTKMKLDNQKEIAEMQNDTQKEIAGIQSATSRQNTKDQVYAQNEMLAYQQKESTDHVASIMENTNLSFF